jgi:hypothetical protein
MRWLVFSVLVVIPTAILFPRTVWSQCEATVDYFDSSWSTDPGVALLCPHGDGEMNTTVYFSIVNTCSPPGVPSPPVEWEDIHMWTAGAGPCGLQDSMAVYTCGILGVTAWRADADTDGYGNTTISCTPCGYGYTEEYRLMVQVRDVVIPQGGDTCLPIAVRSPDIDLDGDVDLVDYSLFGAQFGMSDSGYVIWDRCDLNADGSVDLVDLGLFGSHFGHSCDDCSSQNGICGGS